MINMKEGKKIVLEMLRKNKVRSVEAEFSGSGDSGGVDSVILLPTKELLKAEDELLRNFVHDAATNGGHDWWNNEGGQGTVNIIVKTGIVTVNMSINFTETDDSQYTV